MVFGQLRPTGCPQPRQLPPPLNGHELVCFVTGSPTGRQGFRLQGFWLGPRSKTLLLGYRGRVALLKRSIHIHIYIYLYHIYIYLRSLYIHIHVYTYNIYIYIYIHIQIQNNLLYVNVCVYTCICIYIQTQYSVRL